MNRSSRIRKPSQKAREIAQAALLLASSTDPPRSQSKAAKKEPTTNRPAHRAKVKIGSRKGRATINSNGDVDVEEEANGLQSNSEAEDNSEESADDSDAHDPDVLYCICLGHDDHTPMIQCEGCDNWFHFSCIQLDPAEAQEIAVYYCQVCHASGNGVTRKINEELAPPEAAPDSATKSIPSPSDHTCEEKSPIEPAISDHVPENLNVEMKVDGPSPSQLVDFQVDKKSPSKSPSPEVKKSPLPQERKPPSPEVMKRSSSSNSNKENGTVDNSAAIKLPSKPSRRKPKRAEGLSSEEEDASDQDFTGDEPMRVVDRKRKTSTSIDPRPSNQPRVSVSTTPPAPSTPVLGSEKTRRTCAEQFFKLFEPIFCKKFKQDAGDPLSLQTRSEDAAMHFAEAVEAELFENYAELDAHNQKAPRRQYMTKLRSLLFNLKNNPDFLNNLSLSDLSPRLIVSMSHEDLQTPQQKALAEQIRQRSLHDSVKTVIPSLEPITSHEADEKDTSSLPQSTATVNNGDPVKHPNSHQQSGSFSNALATTSTSLPAVQAQLSQSQPPTASQVSETATDTNPEDVNQKAQLTATGSQAEASKALNSHLLGSFDLEKVFAAIKSVPPSHAASSNTQGTTSQSAATEEQKEAKEGDSEDGMDLENTPEHEMATKSPAATQAEAEKSLPDDYDPFLLANGVDADLDAILHGDPSPAPPSLSTKEPEPQTAATTSAPVVWTGNVMTADVGGFAACAVQVGGRPISPDELTWSKLIPIDTMTVVGRLSVKDSTSYLVQSHFAPTRELIILELRPNLKGPPDLPSPERVTQHKQNLIEFFMKKGRHAVVAVNDKVKQTVRDIYLVPILKQNPVPEFVQLLENVSIPESTPRAQDMMIAVLVLSKGVVPSVWKPASGNPMDPSFNPGVHQADTAPPSSHASSVAPVTSPYPAPPIQSMSASAAMPLLQSLGANISSGSTPLPFSLLSQLPSSVPTISAPGAPPGFVPYVPPQSTLPAPSSNASVNPLDLSKVDVSALQALLSNQQALGPILNQPSSHSHSQTQPHTQSQLQPQSLAQPIPLGPSSTQQNGYFQNNSNNGLRSNGRQSTLPTPPRPMNLPLNPHYGHPNPHQSFSPLINQHQSWMTTDQQLPVVDAYAPMDRDNNYQQHQQRKGLMRMGEVIRSSPNNEDNNHRRRGMNSGPPGAATHRGAGGIAAAPTAGGGRSKRHSYEFVAPPRDGGWAGRGRGKKS